MSTPPDPPGHEPLNRSLKWPQAWRIIASRYPPINLFERVSPNPAVWDVLIQLEAATNPRVRNEVGDISLVPAEKRVSGNNASWVMAPFTHINKIGSRFSDGTYGVYYAAGQMETAVRETAYHFARIARHSSDPPRREDMRVLLGSIDNTFEEVDTLPADLRDAILHKSSYTHSRPFALSRRCAACNGLSYPSVRHDGGRCVAAFWPDAVGIPIQERHLKYEWDGHQVTRYFDYKDGIWVSLI